MLPFPMMISLFREPKFMTAFPVIYEFMFGIEGAGMRKKGMVTHGWKGLTPLWMHSHAEHGNEGTHRFGKTGRTHRFAPTARRAMV